MALTVAAAVKLLRDTGLLREVIAGRRWSLEAPEGGLEPFSSITYDTRAIEPGTLLCCKGGFLADYLAAADEHGLAAYVAGRDYSSRTQAIGLIVNDERKAMSLLAAAFYRHPERELTLIGITGTKGKTTTAYMAHAILNAHSGGRAALFSSVANCLDGHTYTESELTTPESLDAMRMTRQAADNGMRYLVMEVSSQAYKLERVYGLTFDVGAFLNISPDHISPIEHPSFEDYFYCKRRLVANSRALILGADSAHADLIRQEADLHDVPVTTVALHEPGRHVPADLIATSESGERDRFAINEHGRTLGHYRLALPGAFNQANAAAAIAIALNAGTPSSSQALRAVEHTQVPGRMQFFADPHSNTLAVVDYAHNGLSVTALLDYIHERYRQRNPRITLVSGAAGNKALDRRQQIVQAAQRRIDRFIFTQEDTDSEPYLDICEDMQRYVDAPEVDSTIIVDRALALSDAIRDAREHMDRFNVILVIGKGDERWIKDHNRHVAYEGDDMAVKRLFGIQG